MSNNPLNQGNQGNIPHIPAQGVSQEAIPESIPTQLSQEAGLTSQIARQIPPAPQAPPQNKVNAPSPQLKNAASQVMANPALKKQEEAQAKVTTTSAPASKASKEKNRRSQKFLFLLAVTIVMLVPMPKQVGGDVEISGAPSLNQALIRPSVNGTLKEILVKTNQEVKAGQTIAVLRNWEIEEKILEGEKQLLRLKASLGPQSSQINVAQEEYARLKEDYNRQKAESDYVQSQAKGLSDPTAAQPPRIEATKKQLEQIKLQAESMTQKASLHKYLADEGVYPRQSALQSAYEAASAAKQAEALNQQLKAEENELKQRSVEDLPKLNETQRAANANQQRLESVKAELRSTQVQIAEASKQLEIYRKEQEELTLKSPIDGRILTLKTDLLLGQNFNRGDTVAVIGNLSQVRINIQLPEEDRALVKEGQKVTARIRAIPDSVFEGHVDSIAPITSETGEQTNKRKIWDIGMVLENPRGKLNPGMTGYAKIHTGSWRPMIFLTWDEVYKAFRLDRYIDKNPFASLFPHNE